MRKKKIGTYAGIAALIVLPLVLFSLPGVSGPGPLDGFAKCLGEKGAVFYGAFWCPHCQNQKRMFDTSAQYLPYVECSLPSGRGQTQECTDKGITGYPTWVFADESRLSGEIPLKDLAEKTGCELPAGQ